MAKVKKLMGVQQILLSPDAETLALLEYLCEQSGKLYNTGLYFARQMFFKTGQLLTGKFDLGYEPLVAKSVLAQSMPSVPAQQTLMSVTEALKSYQELKQMYFRGELDFKPKVPDYLDGIKLFKVAYPNSGAQRPKLVNGQLKFSLGRTIKRWFGIDELFLPMPSNVEFSKVKEFTILPKNGAFYLELSYEMELQHHELDINQALSIDLGIDNLAACVDTLGNSFLVDGRVMKSMNQLWNKLVSTYKEGKPQDYWDEWLDKITRKRNHQMKDGVNKAAKLIINHCLEHGIGTLVVGWNKGIKDEVNMGATSNQKFVQMPLAKLKERLRQLCQLHGIRFVETEESFTSTSSYLDGDSLPTYGVDLNGWKASGKRISRGLYRTATGLIINADLHGAVNTLKKVARNLGIDLARLGRRCLTTVARVRLWDLPTHTLPAESPRL